MTSSLQWHHAWKKISGLFSILVTFFAVCKQLWAILVNRLVIAKLGWKNYIPQPNTMKKFKIFKKFFSEPFFSTVGDFFKVAIAISLESRVGYQQLFSEFGRFWFCLAIFGKVWVNFSKMQIFADLGPIALHCPALLSDKAKSSKIIKFENFFRDLEKFFLQS